MSDFYVGQMVRVTEDLDRGGWGESKYKVGDILVVEFVDEDGDPSFADDLCKGIGWGDHSWFTPIDTPGPKIELTQIRINGRLYNLVPVEKNNETTE